MIQTVVTGSPSSYVKIPGVYWSKLGSPKCFPRYVDDSVARLTDGRDWSKSEEHLWKVRIASRECLGSEWNLCCFLMLMLLSAFYTGHILKFVEPKSACRNFLIRSLQGLIDIAISTVEDLYEDSGGLPNSLIFPRIEDIEAELDKTTVQDLRQAMTVQIVCSSVEALPVFAVPAMRKTFALCGVVQEVDKVG